MFKKIIFLTCALSYINIFPKTDTEPLTAQESSIYNTIINQYKQQNERITKSEIEQLLQEKHLSIQQLHNILDKHNNILRKTPKYTLWPTYREGGVYLGLSHIISTVSFIIGAPLLAIGLNIKKNTAPSTIQKVASYGLMTIGGITLIPEIILDIQRKGFIAQVVLPEIYEMITHATKKKAEKDREINIEMIITSELMHKLEKLYPELITWEQPTYQ